MQREEKEAFARSTGRFVAAEIDKAVQPLKAEIEEIRNTKMRVRQVHSIDVDEFTDELVDLLKQALDKRDTRIETLERRLEAQGKKISLLSRRLEEANHDA